VFGRRALNSSSINCFIELNLLGQVQRTSQIYGTADPLWPRNEEFYFDVVLPVPNLAAEHEKEPAEQTDNKACDIQYCPAPPPLLSICALHADRTHASSGKKQKKQSAPTWTEPKLLGVSSVDLLPVVTGKMAALDQWIPLYGGDRRTGEVRILAEYTPTDPAPRPGDLCRFTGFCRPSDVFPIPIAETFLVDEVQGDTLYLSYSCPEGWFSTFAVHRYMTICAERHQAALELYQEQLLELAEKLKYSPLAGELVQNYKRLPQEGLLGLSQTLLTEGVSLLGRWFEGGVGTVVGDVVNATNWDGRHTPHVLQQRDSQPDDSNNDSSDDESFIMGSKGSKLDVEGPEEISQREALPGMPQCPITGQPMRDPVVAGDGHTYERSAILRWMHTSDISPMTRATLPHKDLVPNYLLISSISALASSKPAAKETTSYSPSHSLDKPESPQHKVVESLTSNSEFNNHFDDDVASEAHGDDFFEE